MAAPDYQAMLDEALAAQHKLMMPGQTLVSIRLENGETITYRSYEKDKQDLARYIHWLRCQTGEVTAGAVPVVFVH